MIEVDLVVRITAEDDSEADEVLRAIAAAGNLYPDTPVVSITETRRELAR